jgi:CRISPR/Cas system CMR subunit Cmr6 (Cas7 group RAMP superfamily)
MLNIPYIIKSYTVTIVASSGTKFFEGNNSKVSDEIREFAKRTNKGNTVFVDAVAISPDKKEHMVTCTLKVK